ncbi:MAG: MFS transporter, partial [Rhodobacter sp.]|nr:MFS transporter [Rhodobacter sp.]
AMLAARIKSGGGQVFSSWLFLQKSALALAAGATLPALALAGYEPGTSGQDGRAAIAAAYALVPCALKLAAIPVLWFFVRETGGDA